MGELCVLDDFDSADPVRSDNVTSYVSFWGGFFDQTAHGLIVQGIADDYSFSAGGIDSPLHHCLPYFLPRQLGGPDTLEAVSVALAVSLLFFF